MRSSAFNAWTDQSKTATTEQTSLRSALPEEDELDSQRHSNTILKRPNQHSTFEKYSSFSPVVRCAAPTPVRESRANIRNILHSSSSMEGVRDLSTSTKDVSATPFNSTPLFNHPELAARVEEAATNSGLHNNSSFIKFSRISNQTPCIAPTPVKASHRAGLKTASREPSVTSVSSANTVEKASTSEETFSKERSDRPVLIVSPTPKVQHYKPSDNSSLSLRSAVLSSNPGDLVGRPRTGDTRAFSAESNTRFCWEPNVPEVFPSVFRATASASRRIPKTLAQEALLDMEVSVYMTAGHGRVVTPRDWNHRPMNPLAKVFAVGDSMVSARLDMFASSRPFGRQLKIAKVSCFSKLS